MPRARPPDRHIFPQGSEDRQPETETHARRLLGSRASHVGVRVTPAARQVVRAHVSHGGDAGRCIGVRWRVSQEIGLATAPISGAKRNRETSNGRDPNTENTDSRVGDADGTRGEGPSKRYTERHKRGWREDRAGSDRVLEPGSGEPPRRRHSGRRRSDILRQRGAALVCKSAIGCWRTLVQKDVNSPLTRGCDRRGSRPGNPTPGWWRGIWRSAECSGESSSDREAHSRTSLRPHSNIR